VFHGAGLVLGRWTGDDDAVADWNQQIIDEFRANGGTVETNGFGRSLVLVHHLGAKTGTERVSPVANIRQPDGSRLIAASKGGAPDNPAWYHNLLAHPDVTIETPDGVEQVHVTELRGAERDAGWAQFTTMSEGFRSYEQKTSRVIPVLRLTPVA
jgi:deazaflavin-dependent oxidoreductase (nitroreductase family)